MLYIITVDNDPEQTFHLSYETRASDGAFLYMDKDSRAHYAEVDSVTVVAAFLTDKQAEWWARFKRDNPAPLVDDA